jgi:hypothetical protein
VAGSGVFFFDVLLVTPTHHGSRWDHDGAAGKRCADADSAIFRVDVVLLVEVDTNNKPLDRGERLVIDVRERPAIAAITKLDVRRPRLAQTRERVAGGEAVKCRALRGSRHFQDGPD